MSLTPRDYAVQISHNVANAPAPRCGRIDSNETLIRCAVEQLEAAMAAARADERMKCEKEYAAALEPVATEQEQDWAE